MITLDIPGKPVPYKAPKVYQNRTFNPRHGEKHEVQEEIRRQYSGPLLENSISVLFIFYFEVPKSFSKKKRQKALDCELMYTSKPDIDNLLKFYNDTLIGTVIEDDSNIVHLSASKFYSEKPSTHIYIQDYS